MIRPIESSLSLYTVDHKAHQAQNDPNAHAAQALQQGEIAKKTMQETFTVQKSPEAEGEVKIRDGNSEKNKHDQRKKRRRQDGSGTEREALQEEDGDGGHLNFLA
jgi:hypothetical protein